MARYAERDQNICLNNYGKERSLQIINFEGFTQNGHYGNQPHPFEVLKKELTALTPADPALLQHNI